MIDNCPLFGSVAENDSSIDYRHFSTYEPVDSFGISDHQHGSIDCVAIRNGQHVGGSDHSRLSSRRQGGSVHGRNNWDCLFLSSARCHRNCKQAWSERNLQSPEADPKCRQFYSRVLAVKGMWHVCSKAWVVWPIDLRTIPRVFYSCDVFLFVLRPLSEMREPVLGLHRKRVHVISLPLGPPIQRLHRVLSRSLQ